MKHPNISEGFAISLEPVVDNYHKESRLFE